MKRLFKEFLASLKKIELEEPVDLWLYRPPAFLLVKALAPTPVTPNMVSVASALCGFFAAALFWRGDPAGYGVAALFCYISHLFDCADGQLARLRQQKSYVGYLMDGMMDYFGSVAIFIGIGHGLAVQTGRPAASWALTIAGGLSAGWACYIVDRKRMEWMHRVYNKFAGDDGEVSDMERDAAVWRKEGSHLILRSVILLYVAYTRVWGSVTRPLSKAGSEKGAEAWRRANLPYLKMALLTGPAAHYLMIAVFGALNRHELYLWGVLTLGNAWVLLVLFAQSRPRVTAEAGS